MKDEKGRTEIVNIPALKHSVKTVDCKEAPQHE